MRSGAALIQMRQSLISIGALAICLAWLNSATAQELAPRAFWPAPQGTNLLALGYQYSTGDIITDPSLPIVGVESDIHYAQATYQRTVSLLNRTTNLQLSLPYTWGDIKGQVEGEFRDREIADLADLRMLFSINLLGAASMDRAGFQALRANPRTIIGFSFLIQAPTGEYEKDKAINAGTNRWSVKPALGLIWPIRTDIFFEAQLGAWLFGDNDDFLGVTREQDPIYSTEVHLIKDTRAGFWASVDLNYYFGGRSIIDGQARGDLQRNSRIGVTVLYPFAKGHAIRGSFSTGLVTDSGGDYEMFSLSYLHTW